MSLKKLSVILLLIILFWSCESRQNDKLMIATAANIQFAMIEICEAFELESEIPTEIIIGSSGKLTAQIEQGAPFDVFVSADMFYPEELFSHGFSVHEPEIYGYGQLVIWTMKDGVAAELSTLTSSATQHIAIANPKTAPYGKAALDFLKTKGIDKSVETKLVYGESISQTNQFIMSETAEIGISSVSSVLSPQMIGKGNWMLIDSTDYTPIAQGALVIKKDEDVQNAQEFYDFLFSEKAKAIFGKYQYLEGK